MLIGSVISAFAKDRIHKLFGGMRNKTSILLNPQLMIYSAALGGTMMAIRLVSCFL